MPIFKIPKAEINYPPAQFADSEGLLCEGGGLSPQQLVSAYKSGLYFWFHPMRYIKWWTPDPRIILLPSNLDVPEYLEKEITNLNYSATFDNDLETIMRLCMSVENTSEMNPAWITERTIRVFKEMDSHGHVKSVGVYKNDELVGGLFGVSIGKVFFGEYICGTDENASVFALISLVKKLSVEGFELFDLHKDTNETIDIGLSEMSRNEYLSLLKELT